MNEAGKDIEINEYDGNVLFVDDEDNILISIKRGLMDEEFGQFYTNNGYDALKIMEENEIAVLVTDMKMPEMSGLELIRITNEKFPETVKMILSGYAQVSNLLAAINSGQIFRYIVKPWKMESEFIPAIKQALKYYNLRKQKKLLLEQLKIRNAELQEKMEEEKRLKEIIEAQLKKREKALDSITQKVIPFTSEVIQTMDGLSVLDPQSIQLISTDLKKKGMEILEILRKLEAILKQ
jgi:DNA-binding NtrC family response regulator